MEPDRYTDVGHFGVFSKIADIIFNGVFVDDVKWRSLRAELVKITHSGMIIDEGGFGAVSDGAMLDELVKPLFERLALRVHFDFHLLFLLYFFETVTDQKKRTGGKEQV